jgi:hypothetical protein
VLPQCGDNIREHAAPELSVDGSLGATWPPGVRANECVTGSNPSATDYILETPAKCPNCRREILER